MRFWVNGLAWKIHLKIGKFARKLKDLPSNPIRFNAVPNEFASCSDYGIIRFVKS